MSAVSVPYLGKPGAMRALPSPNSPITAEPIYGDAVHRLLSGGIAVVRAGLNVKRAYSLPYVGLDSAGAAIILGFYHRLYGLGPFAFVDPSARNVLWLDVATVGLRAQAAHGWVKSAGTLATAATGGPAGLDSGVLTWSSLAASATLQPGTVANTAETQLAPAYLPTEPVTVSLYAKASSSTTASLQLTGYDAAGAVLVTSVAASMSLTTTWTRFSASIAAGAAAFASAAFVLPRIVLGGSVPTSVSIAGAQLEYGTAATAFEPGHGSPRVLPSGPPGRDVQQTVDYATDHTLTLAEV